MTGPKIANLQALRGVAVLLVLLRHVSVMEDRYGHHASFLPDFFNAGTSGVDLFFVISGFVMAATCAGRHQVPGAFLEFLYRRATRIYPLYWIFSFVVLGVSLVQPAWVNSSYGERPDLVASFLLLPQSLPPLLGQGWTLIHEVFFYFVFAFSLLLPERRLPLFLGGWAIALALGWIFVLPALPPTGLAAIFIMVHPLAAEFLFGAVSALCVPRMSFRAGVACFVAGCVALGVMLCSPAPDLPLVGRILIRGVIGLALVHGAVAMERTGRILLPRFLRTIGDASYSIYLSHILVISLIGRVWSSIKWSGPWDNFAVTVLMIAGALVCGLGCHRFLERPLLRLVPRRQPRGSPVEHPPRSLSSVFHTLRRDS